MKKNILLSLLFILTFQFAGYSQNTVDIKGRAICKKTGEPIMFGSVNLKEIGQWTITDEKGNFVFHNIKPAAYTLEVSCLGYEPHSASIAIDSKTNEILIKLIPHSFDMEEVSILAKKKTDITTTTDIKSAAIEYIQPTSLGDIMQLVPGNIAENPDLSGPQQVAIREIGTDNNSANGTAIIVDGAPISNDANMQTLSRSYLENDYNNFNTVAGGGVDLRNISSDNIESVEIIKGIPSVVYGDLTSGAIVVNTKAGYTPLEVKAKADPKIKQVALNKGIKLVKNHSFVNFDLDYINSYSDLTSKYKGFSRITGDVAYSSVFFKNTKPLSFNAKLSYFGTIDDEKTDPDAFTDEEEYSNKENGIRVNLNGKWSLKTKLISNLKYNFSFSYTHQESYEKRYRTSGGNVESISFALEEGENYGIFLPIEQLTELTIDGIPVQYFGQITAGNSNLYDNGIINKVIYGAEYKRNENLGEGQIYDLENPPVVASNTTRPRAFKDIPALQNYSVYLEDKIKIPISSTAVTVQAGARLNNFQAEGLLSSDVGFYLEPRINLQYDILNKENNNLFDKLAVSFGYGKNYKSPSLYNLYPEDTYYDLAVLNHPDSETAIFYTLIYDSSNPDLKPSSNTKQEISIDFKVKSISGNITGFYENLEDGFGYQKKYEFVDYYLYDASGVAEGETPDPATLPTIEADYILGYLIPVNNEQTKKMGIEYSLGLGEIKFLYTSFNVDGAWLRTERVYSTTDYLYLPSSGTSEQFDYVGVFPAGESKISERLNTNLRMVTHIPRLRLILSTTMQMIWYDKYYYPTYDEQPIYLIDGDGNQIAFDEEFLEANPLYQKYITVKSDTYYKTEVMSPLWVANIRLSKEINDNIKLSFYVNNFLNYRPMYQYTRSESYVRRNQNIYFGAELKFNI